MYFAGWIFFSDLICWSLCLISMFTLLQLIGSLYRGVASTNVLNLGYISSVFPTFSDGPSGDLAASLLLLADVFVLYIGFATLSLWFTFVYSLNWYWGHVFSSSLFLVFALGRLSWISVPIFGLSRFLIGSAYIIKRVAPIWLHWKTPLLSVSHFPMYPSHFGRSLFHRCTIVNVRINPPGIPAA